MARNKKGFTMIELLIVIAVIAVLAIVVFILLDPATRFAKSRNAQRWTDTRAVVDAVSLYQIDNISGLPVGIDTDLKMMGTAGTGCSVVCGPSVVAEIDSFVDSSQDDFDLGTYDNTQYSDGINISSGTSGSYSSEIMNSTGESAWSSIAYSPSFPAGKQLPDSGNDESGYSSGNMDMSDNELLLHLNGSTVDSSGNGVSITNNGALSTSGKFNSAMSFHGVDDSLSFNGLPGTYGVNAKESMMAWVRFDGSYDSGVLFNGVYAGWNTVWFTSNAFRFDAADQYGPTDVRGNYVYYLNTFSPNVWYHVAVTFDSETGEAKLFINGQKVAEKDLGITIVSPNNAIKSIGKYSNRTDGFLRASIDEVAVFSRVLSEDEIEDVYARGANSVLVQVRSCDDSLCSGESFVGPDGTGGTYYSDVTNTSGSTPTLSLTNLSDNAYFQYKVDLASSNASYNPSLNRFVSSYSLGSSTEFDEVTVDECVDLNSELAGYLPGVPYDPKYGDEEMTYYGIRQTSTGAIKVKSCRPELGVNVEVVK
jgi:prepilin-type N-terminal cleavage/methylation domain-containing protein